jgi:hypothetical protein
MKTTIDSIAPEDVGFKGHDTQVSMNSQVAPVAVQTGVVIPKYKTPEERVYGWIRITYGKNHPPDLIEGIFHKLPYCRELLEKYQEEDARSGICPAQPVIDKALDLGDVEKKIVVSSYISESGNTGAPDYEDDVVPEHNDADSDNTAQASIEPTNSLVTVEAGNPDEPEIEHTTVKEEILFQQIQGVECMNLESFKPMAVDWLWEECQE